MSIEMLLYLANVSDSLKDFLIIIGLISSLVFCFSIGIMMFAWADSFTNEKENKECKRIFSKIFSYLWIIILIWIIEIMIPSQKTTYTILAAHAVKESQISEKVVNVINEKLDELSKKDSKP